MKPNLIFSEKYDDVFMSVKNLVDFENWIKRTHIRQNRFNSGVTLFNWIVAGSLLYLYIKYKEFEKQNKREE